MKHTEYPRRIWDSVAQDYDTIWEVPDYTPILQSIIREAEIDSGMKILEIATETANVAGYQYFILK